MGALEYDAEVMRAFMQERIPGLCLPPNATFLGWRKGDEVVAGAAYEGFNGRNVWVHLAGVGKTWMSRDFLRAGFAYPFLVCGVDRLSGYVNASNVQARRLNEHFGYQVEATLHGAAPDGGDVLLYVMWRKDCRYV